MISSHVKIKCYLHKWNITVANTLRLSQQKTVSVKWLSLVLHWCLNNKYNTTWPLGDMEFLFSCWKNISLLNCAHSWNIFQHSKRNFVSPRSHVISSISTAMIALKIYLLLPLKQFETTTNQEILKALVSHRESCFHVLSPIQDFQTFCCKVSTFF